MGRVIRNLLKRLTNSGRFTMTDKAKMLKKLVLQNRFTLDEISRMTGVQPADMPEMYKAYTGQDIPESLFIVGHDDEIAKLKSAVLAGEKVIITGPPGIGKTISARKAIRDAGFTINEINISDNRTKDMLESKLFGGHLVGSTTCFLFDEVDNFYWRSHAAFKAIVESSRAPILMTCNYIEKIPESIKKICKVMKMKPPTMKDLQAFITTKFPHLSLKAQDLYNPDFRKVMTHILYGVKDDHEPERWYNAEALAGVIIGEPSPVKRLNAMNHAEDQLSWSINWIDNALPRVSPSLEATTTMLNELSIIDSWARRTNQKYIASMMAALPCFNRRVKLDFPVTLMRAEKKKEKPVVEESEGVTKVAVKKKQKLESKKMNLDDF